VHVPQTGHNDRPFQSENTLIQKDCGFRNLRGKDGSRDAVPLSHYTAEGANSFADSRLQQGKQFEGFHFFHGEPLLIEMSGSA